MAPPKLHFWKCKDVRADPELI